MRTNAATRPNGGPSHQDPTESTPLINGGGNTDHGGHFWHDVFLDPKKTPGMDSHNPFVSWPVNAFNVFKMTLLSSTSIPSRLALSQHKAATRLFPIYARLMYSSLLQVM